MEPLHQNAQDHLDSATYPVSLDSLPSGSFQHGKYLVCFARDRSQLTKVQRLRFQVFNLELGEGLAASHETGLDIDEFDPGCHHLMVIDSTQGEVVGTYRLQTSAMAKRHRGFYSSGEFDLSFLPEGIRSHSVELGRACISLAHRNRQVLFMLWKGLASYVAHNRHRYLFGCSSLTSQDPQEGHSMLAYLRNQGHMHSDLEIPPRPDFECPLQPGTDEELLDVRVPSLFRTYLRYGAKICGPPAIDREFKTIDFFTLFDLAQLDERRYQLFFE